MNNFLLMVGGALFVVVLSFLFGFISAWVKDKRSKDMKEDDDDIQEYVRPWVGLTDEEILEHQDCVPNSYSLDLIEFAQAIEAKLKEKNT
jgi:hypothetical protein